MTPPKKSTLKTEADLAFETTICVTDDKLQNNINTDLLPVFQNLLDEIREMIEATRQRVAIGVNREIIFLYWTIGTRIHQDILETNRGEYGEKIVQTLSEQLQADYGRGFSRTNVFTMVRFAEKYEDPGIVQTLSGHVSWSHFIHLIRIEESLPRDFYTEMCRIERWSVRTLRAKIQSMLFERTALSRKPDELAQKEIEALRTEDLMTPDIVFRDPYFLDFLNLSDSYAEKDLESAIIHEIERFILEIGSDFSFIARQKRITVDSEDYYIDLLFFHRRLRCLIAIDLKIGKFQAADKGQMELYLRWLDKYERISGEESPMGLILCAGKSDEHVELLGLSESGIRVAEYLTELPPRKLLEERLKSVVALARRRLDQRVDNSG